MTVVLQKLIGNSSTNVGWPSAILLDIVLIFQSTPSHKPGYYLDCVIQILSQLSLNHPNIDAMYSKILIVWYNK